MLSLPKRLTLWKAIFLFLSTLSTLVEAGKQCETAKYENKPRVFVTSDIGGDVDDQMSVVRLLTYSNELIIEGLVATTSIYVQNTTHVDLMYEIIDAYVEVVNHLNANVPSAGSYPSAQHLYNVTCASKPVYGIASLSSPLSTAAKNLITAVDSSEDPLWVVNWGGASVLAEALNYVRGNRSMSDTDDFVAKLRVYAISDQDNAGPWVRQNFPNLFYIVSIHAFSRYREATWTGISSEVMNNFDIGGPDSSLVTNAWLDANIRIGPLGAVYPQFEYAMEGDSPSWMYLIPNGLGSPEHPDWGSWGGRYAAVDDGTGIVSIFGNTDDNVQGMNGENFTSAQASIWRWREAYQYDFAARMNWSVSSNSSAVNHAPIVVLNETCGPTPIELNFTSGDTFVFDASESWDPDGDEISYDWMFYAEVAPEFSQINFFASLYNTTISLYDIEYLNPDKSKVAVTPLFGYDHHFILTVSDNREMPLVTYQRIVMYSQES